MLGLAMEISKRCRAAFYKHGRKRYALRVKHQEDTAAFEQALDEHFECLRNVETIIFSPTESAECVLCETPVLGIQCVTGFGDILHWGCAGCPDTAAFETSSWQRRRRKGAKLPAQRKHRAQPHARHTANVPCCRPLCSGHTHTHTHIRVIQSLTRTSGRRRPACRWYTRRRTRPAASHRQVPRLCLVPTRSAIQEVRPSFACMKRGRPVILIYCAAIRKRYNVGLTQTKAKDDRNGQGGCTFDHVKPGIEQAHEELVRSHFKIPINLERNSIDASVCFAFLVAM